MDDLDALVPTARAPTSDQLLADPATSYWLRDALTSALARDPADAALDAVVLHDVLVQRFDEVLSAMRGPALGEA